MKGWKTYLFAALIAVATGAKAAGLIDEKVYEIMVGLLGSGGLAALRAAVQK